MSEQQPVSEAEDKENRVKAATVTLESLGGREKSLTKRLLELETDIQAQEKLLEAKKKQVEQVKVELQTSKQQLTAQQDHEKTETAKSKERLKALKQEINTETSKLTDLETKAAELSVKLNKELKTYEEQVSKVTASLAELNTKYQTLLKEYEDVKTKCLNQKRLYEQLLKTTKETEDRLRDLGYTQADQQLKLDDLGRKVVIARQNQEEAFQAVRRLEERLEKLKAEIKVLEEEKKGLVDIEVRLNIKKDELKRYTQNLKDKYTALGLKFNFNENID